MRRAWAPAWGLSLGTPADGNLRCTAERCSERRRYGLTPRCVDREGAARSLRLKARSAEIGRSYRSVPPSIAAYRSSGWQMGGQGGPPTSRRAGMLSCHSDGYQIETVAGAHGSRTHPGRRGPPRNGFEDRSAWYRGVRRVSLRHVLSGFGGSGMSFSSLSNAPYRSGGRQNGRPDCSDSFEAQRYREASALRVPPSDLDRHTQVSELLLCLVASQKLSRSVSDRPFLDSVQLLITQRARG